MEIHTLKYVNFDDFKENDCLYYINNQIHCDEGFGKFFMYPQPILESLKLHFCEELDLDEDDFKFSDIPELALKAVDISKIYEHYKYESILEVTEQLIKLSTEDILISCHGC